LCGIAFIAGNFLRLGWQAETAEKRIRQAFSETEKELTSCLFL